LEFRILGSGAAIADPRKSQSCLWLEEQQLLIDCGEGSAAKLVKFNLLSKVKAIAISHFHPDHVIGLFSVLQNMHILKRKDPLNIYLPESIQQFKETLKMFYLDVRTFSFNCRLLSTKDIGNEFDITPIPTSHLKKYTNLSNERNSYAFYLPKSGFAYSSDVNSLDFLKQVDNKGIIVLDGFHLDAEEILHLGRDCESRIILTHGLSQKLKKKISMTNRFEIADENKKYNFQRIYTPSSRLQQ